MLKRLFIFPMLFACMMLMLVPDLFACSCRARPTVLDAFENSDIVVATRLVSVEKVREKERKYDIDYIRSATMIITKVYKGNVKPGQELKFAQGGGADCVWTFDEEWVNDEFLFYLGKPTKGHPFISDEESESAEPMYRAITCGRSNSLEGAVDDLAYLDNLNKTRGRTRLSGRFGAWWFNDDFSGAGIKLKITGKSKSYDAKADKNGFFEIYDLPAGEYVVSVTAPFGWKINDYMLEHTSTGYAEFDPRSKPKAKNQIPIRIEKGKHTALDLTFDIDTAIKGRVLSPEGKPMKGVCVKAVSTELKEGDYRGRSDCTNEKGEFSIEEMAPDNYMLIVNDDGQMDADEPFGIVFYPGVSEFKNAGVIAVEPGKYVQGRVIQIPQLTELVTIKGRFLFSDGEPVVDKWVKFVPDDAKRFDDMNQETDSSGGFIFRLPKGAVGKIFGEMSTYSGEFKNCEKLEAIIKATGSTWLTAKSSVVEVNSLAPSELVEIVFPFPYCEKAEKN